MRSGGGDLRDRCHVNTNREGDRFVGVRADSEQITVSFPLGYRLPEGEQVLRRDILRLFSLLGEFSKNGREGELQKSARSAPQAVAFPVDAYLELISRFLAQHTYYIEREPYYRTGDRGNTDWGRTVRRQRPMLQANGSPVYLKRTVRVASPNERRLITQIHKYCVHVSFQRLGWLFTAEVPPAPDIPIELRRFQAELSRKLNSTHDDGDRRLFSAMLAVLKSSDANTDSREFQYGTCRFEYVWEGMIDRVFGVRDRERYFPRASWRLQQDAPRGAGALRPDTIMRRNGKVYVLDAKYYAYGATGAFSDLPATASIHKQITYGEYIATHKKFRDEQGANPTVYNAFLMPYDREENPMGLSGRLALCGEAAGDWKGQDQPYERVQGILVDVSDLMHCVRTDYTRAVMELAEIIEEAVGTQEWDGYAPE